MNIQTLPLSELVLARDLMDRIISDFKSNLPRQVSKGGSELILTEDDRAHIEMMESRRKRIVDAINLIIESL